MSLYICSCFFLSQYALITLLVFTQWYTHTQLHGAYILFVRSRELALSSVISPFSPLIPFRRGEFSRSKRQEIKYEQQLGKFITHSLTFYIYMILFFFYFLQSAKLIVYSSSS